MVEKSIDVKITTVTHPNGQVSYMVTKHLKANRKLDKDEYDVLCFLDGVMSVAEYRNVRSELYNSDYKTRKYFGTYLLERTLTENEVIINGNVNSDWMLDKINHFGQYANEQFDDVDI